MRFAQEEAISGPCGKLDAGVQASASKDSVGAVTAWSAYLREKFARDASLGEGHNSRFGRSCGWRGEEQREGSGAWVGGWLAEGLLEGICVSGAVVIWAVYALSSSIGAQKQYPPRLVLSEKLALGQISLGAVLLLHETIVPAKESRCGCSRRIGSSPRRVRGFVSGMANGRRNCEVSVLRRGLNSARLSGAHIEQII